METIIVITFIFAILTLVLGAVWYFSNNETIYKISQFCFAMFIPLFFGVCAVKAYDLIMSFF